MPPCQAPWEPPEFDRCQLGFVSPAGGSHTKRDPGSRLHNVLGAASLFLPAVYYLSVGRIAEPQFSPGRPAK